MAQKQLFSNSLITKIAVKFLASSVCFFAIFSAQSQAATSLRDVIEEAQLNNRNIKLEKIRYQTTKTLKSEAVSEFLPNVKATVQYGNRNSFYQGQTYDRSTRQRIDELTVEQPIFDGLHSVSKVQEAEYKIKSSSAKLTDKVQEISYAAVESFCNLFRYENLTKLNKENKDLAKDLVSLAQRRKTAKIIDNADMIKFDYELSIVEERYFDSFNRLNKAKYDYQNIVGKLDENLIRPEIVEEKFNANEVLEAAQKNNSNVRSYLLNYQAAKAAYNAEKSNFSPKVYLTASSSKQTNVVYLNNEDLRSKSLFLNLSVPIFQKGVEYANLNKANYQKDAALEEYEIAREQIQKEVSKTLEEYNFYSELSKTNKKTAELAKNRFEILNRRYELKLEDPIEVIRAKIEYNNRQISYIESQMDMIIAYYKLKYFLGDI